jgi:hypothetical protein
MTAAGGYVVWLLLASEKFATVRFIQCTTGSSGTSAEEVKREANYRTLPARWSPAPSTSHLERRTESFDF